MYFLKRGIEVAGAVIRPDRWYCAYVYEVSKYITEIASIREAEELGTRNNRIVIGETRRIPFNGSNVDGGAWNGGR